MSNEYEIKRIKKSLANASKISVVNELYDELIELVGE